MHEKSVAELDFAELMRDRSFHPSPDAWEDQLLYFLLVDRFSDGQEKHYRDNAGELVREGKTPPFEPQDAGNAVRTEEDAAKWRAAGDDWVGGNLKGLTSKLGYLKRLGVTAVWVSPVFKQAAYAEHTYHGYGIQNFLEIDPHFGTREDLKELVGTAHGMGIYVVLDVIVNHAGDVFAYDVPDGQGAPWNGGEYPVKGFRDAVGAPSLPFGPVNLDEHPDAWPEAAVWPAELQRPEAFGRKGYINSWDNFPEFEEGDFFGLKDFNPGHWEGEEFVPSDALKALCACYKFWIAYADLDGFRLDTVKHMGAGAVRYFASEMHEFAQSLGKRNFYLIGEIAGGRANAFETLNRTGLDAALGIDEIPGLMRDLVGGRRSPAEYFDRFRNYPKDGDPNDPAWCRNRIVTFFDDHDQVGRPVKGRLAAEYPDSRGQAENAVIAALGVNLTTLGIPCVYYGSEQAFDGHAIDEHGDNRYTREAMLGGAFGSRASRGRHFFNEDARVYKELAKIATLRGQRPALRRGRQYLRDISEDGVHFGPPQASPDGEYRGIVAWSRLLDVDELVMAVNTDPHVPRSAWVTLDDERHPANGRGLRCVYSTNPAQVGTETCPPDGRNGSAVCLPVPPGGFVIFE